MNPPSPTSARATAAIAYLFTFPLVVRYRRMYRQAVDRRSPTFSGGFGTWLDERRTVERLDCGVRSLDGVVRSSAWLDLRAEPWWCSVGDVPSDVSFVGWLVDLWGFPVCELDSVRRGPVLASAPVRVRNVPQEVRTIARGESSVVQFVTETSWADPEGSRGSPPARPPVVIEPMSARAGGSNRRPPAAAPLPAWTDGIEIGTEFWSIANFALSLTAANTDDRHILEQIAGIGVGPAASWSCAGFSPDVVEAIEDGMNDALNDLLSGSAEDPHVPPTPIGRADMDRDYFARALAALCLELRVEG